MNEGVKISVMTSGGDVEDFAIDIGLHKGSALSLFLFDIVVDVLTKGIQEGVPWCMLFAYDIVFINETRDGLNHKLEQ